MSVFQSLILDNKEKVQHLVQDAAVVFVSSYQTPAQNSYSQIVNNRKAGTAEFENVLTQVQIRLTSGNSPGSFSIQLVDKVVYNETLKCHTSMFMELDDPNLEIPKLHAYGNRKATSVNQKRSKDKKSNTVKSSQATTVTDNDPAVVYSTPDYTSWKARKHYALYNKATNDFIPIQCTYNTKGKLNNAWYFYQKEGETFAKCYDLEPSQLESGSIPATDGYTLQIVSNEAFLSEPYYDTFTNNTGLKQKFTGKCKISPMDRLIIFLPSYYEQGKLVQSFTGVVNTVQSSYNNNSFTIQIQGEDVTKYLRLSVFNLQPALAFEGSKTIVNQLAADNITIFSSKLDGKYAPDVIEGMTVGNDSLNTKGGIGQWKLAHGGNYTITYDSKSDKFIKKDGKGGSTATIDMRNALGELFQPSSVHILNPFKRGSNGYRKYVLKMGGMWSFFQAEFQTRRDICYKVAEDCKFMFYADQKGHLWFRPQRFENQHILCRPAENNPYIIDTASIESYGVVEDDNNIYTTVHVSFDPPLAMDGLSETGMFTREYRDDVATLKYGVRILSVSNPVARVDDDNAKVCYAKSLLQRILASKYQGQVTIIGRPELEQGHPVYIPCLNRVFFVETIEHNFTFGQTYLTTLHLTYGRKPWEHVPEVMSFTGHDASVYITDANMLPDVEFIK